MKRWIGFEKGINLGGWLSQCPYELEHYECFITERDIETIASWGVDHIRLPIDYEVIHGIELEETCEGTIYIDRCIEWCRKNNLNLILDLHKVPGFSFNQVEQNTLFDDVLLQERYLKIWDSLARLYSQYSDFVSFELLNEIVEQEETRWNKLASQAIQIIRKYSQKIYIVVGGIQWNSVHTLKLLDIPLDDNIVYNFHFYEPFLFTHQSAPWITQMPQEKREYPDDLDTYRRVSKEINSFGSGLYNPGVTEMGKEFMIALIDEAVKAAEVKHVFLYCGEYGVIYNAPSDSIVRWYEDINQVFVSKGIARAAWTYKSLDFGISDWYDADIRGSVISNL